MSEQVRCDQCGATVPRGTHEGWLSLYRFRKGHRDDLLARMSLGAHAVDLCSWKCLGNYAFEQPEPVAPE